MACVEYSRKNIVFGVRARRQSYDFYYGDLEASRCLYEGADARLINPEIVGGMVGTMIGMFATGNGVMSANKASFDWFSYESK